MQSKDNTRRRRGLLAFGAVFLLVLAAGAIYYPRLQQRWRTPLGPSLGLPTRTPLPPSSVTPGALVVSESKQNPVQPTLPATEETVALATNIPATPTNELTPTPKPLCGGPTVSYVLAIGADNRDDTYLYGLADVIRIARIDFITPKVTVLSMPRDLWVEIPEISDHYNITHGKLNQAYLYGGPGMGYYDGPGGGPGLLARTLDLNFGLLVDHYGAVNMQTFVKVIDAVGGIDVYLPSDVDGRPIDAKTEDMGYFTAGQHHFTGDEALRFARIRKKYSDFARMDNQNMVLCSLRKKLTSTKMIPAIPGIIASFQDNVQTDLTPEQISQYACLLPKLPRENIIFTSLPDEIMKPGRIYSPQQKDNTFILEVDNEVVRDYLQQFMAGTWPDKPNEPSCP